ncbi:MAG: hypothetical protein ACI87W_002116, partial [Halieaceae bacterium]
NAIPRNDTYRLYLAYHEGHGGYTRATYKSKEWLQTVARKVASRAQRYETQLRGCEEDLQDDKTFFGWF